MGRCAGSRSRPSGTLHHLICRCQLLVVTTVAVAASAQAQEPPQLPPETPSAETPVPPEAPLPKAAPLEEPDGIDLFGIPVHGSFSTRYRLRHAGSETDQDAYGLLDLQLGDADTQRFTGHLVARGALDLDGNTDHGSDAYVFDSIEDTYGSRAAGVLYEANATYHPDGSIDDITLGRQVLYETPVSTYFDGLRIDSEALGSLHLKLGAYGGVPSHLYESSPHGDLILGAWGEARPWTAGRMRLDYMQVEDDYLFYSNNNAMVRVAVWQQLGESLDLFGNYTLLDWKGRDFELRGNWVKIDSDVRVQLDYYELLTTQSAEALEFDPFFNIAGEYHPYREIRGSASKGIGDHVDLTAGADIRRLASDSDEGEFNRDFERWYVSPSLIDCPIDGMTITVTGELWDADAEKITTGGADVSQRFSKDTKAHAGTVYSLYKYDYYTASEQDHVRTYYVGIDSKYSKRLRLRLFYEFEVDPFSKYHTVQVAAAWTF